VSTTARHSAAQIAPKPPEPERPHWKWKAAVGGLIGLFVLLACYDLFSGVAGSTGGNSAAVTVSPSPARAATTSPSSAVPTAPAKSPRAPNSPAPHALTVASVAAFGPDGTTDGDNPALAASILDVSAAQPWYSQWYATPEFGNLQSGTGLLLDMGGSVTVTGVQLVLGSSPGASLQVQIGNSPSPTGLVPVASASDVGSTVDLTVPAGANGRYVLIWFTKLPPRPQGHYQVQVYDVTVDGTAR
jgi:hypothetical protein